MIKKTLELFGSPEGYEEAPVRFTTAPDAGYAWGEHGVAIMYVPNDKRGIFFTLEEAKAMHKFFGDIVYSQDGEAW